MTAMSDIAIRVENLSKRYRRGLPSGNDRLSEALSNLGRALLQAPRRLRRQSVEAPAPAAERSGEFWALKDVSFEVKRGEVVGIIGRNGAGKSTLLKIFSRITEPTSGRFGVAGRVGSLLEVGTGFHPELTGRENVFLNGTFLGMSRREIARKFDAIAAFAEIDDFLDTPVKRYSSGMQVRLGFAVAAHLDPDILIVDEALAVGDAAFQKKCLEKMQEVAGSGRTVLFVSHSMEAVGRLCSRGVWLDCGRVVTTGPAVDVLASYLERLAGPGANGAGAKEEAPGVVEITPQPGELPIAGDFSAGLTEHFQVRAGRWTVGGGRYTARPRGREEAISILLLDGPMPARFDVAVEMTPEPSPSGEACNGLLLFDFIDQGRFKFAGCYVGLGRWVIGERVGDEWRTLAAVAVPLMTGHTYAVALAVDGSAARLKVASCADLVHQFTAWHGGTVGFATRGAVAHFRALQIRSGQEAIPHHAPEARDVRSQE